MIRFIAVLLTLAAPAQAQTACTGLPDALAALAARYAEAPRVSGLMANGQLMIITASEAGGFTVLIVTPEGLACMVASGSAFEVRAPEPAGVDG
ncbi:MAG: hypothetical protein KBG46_14395 [Paracoccus sp.]|nr:hypothetical protein [Paracoccus sp. (in: a-proteobacteria)]